MCLCYLSVCFSRVFRISLDQPFCLAESEGCVPQQAMCVWVREWVWVCLYVCVCVAACVTETQCVRVAGVDVVLCCAVVGVGARVCLCVYVCVCVRERERKRERERLCMCVRAK